MNRRLTAAAAAAPVAVFLCVYLARAGHGFLLDDFDWVLNSRVRSLDDLGRLFAGGGGFYRPLTALTFTVNEWLFGARPLGYGLTNVALALACAAAVAFVARGFALSRGAAAVAGLVWLMNLHFTRTGILWICGRTALVVTLFAALSAGWLLRGRLAAAAACLALALLAKEEAVLLPFILFAWLLVMRSATGRAPVGIGRWAVSSGVVLALYLAARGLTPAMTPGTAPEYYRFTFEPAAVLRNAGEYADRTSSLAVAIVLLGAALLGRARPLLDDRTRAVVRSGALWLVIALAFAFVLPVRSDLYAAVPCVGACLAAAALTERLWQASTPVRRQRALVAAVVATLLVSPVYWLRTQRLARLAAFSQAALEDLDRLTRHLPDRARVIVTDAEAEPGVRVPTMAAAFGAQLNAAFELRTGRRLDLALASEDAAGAVDRGAPTAPAAQLAVRDGRVVSIGPAPAGDPSAGRLRRFPPPR